MTVQDQVIEFLSTTSAYALPDHGCSGFVPSVERRETHISIVFLVGQLAYKMKRAIKYPYLDFSTLGHRRELCEREVQINGRTAPDIYRGVVPVTRDENGCFALNGSGVVVEWLVAMNRFDDSLLWSNLAQGERLGRRDFDVLADRVDRFHSIAEVCDGRSAVAAMADTIDGNEQSMADHVGGVFEVKTVSAVAAQTRHAFDGLKALLATRAENGSIRVCHGDLHLGNIFMDDGNPVLFDAIEFNDAFSHIDTAYDFAFLLMDVEHRVGKRRATGLMNRYLDHQDDRTVLTVLPFFMSVRAAIRAHVSASAAAQHADPSTASNLRNHAVRYLDHAISCLQPVPPCLVAVGGLSGSGKSRMARVIAGAMSGAPGSRVVRSDTVRKRLAGRAFDERLPSESYTAASSARTYDACMTEARQVLQSGAPVVLDAVFSKPEERFAARALADELGVPFHGLWLEAPLSVMLQRVEKRRHNPSDADGAVVSLQSDYDLGEIDWDRIDSSGEKERTETVGFKLLGLEPSAE